MPADFPKTRWSLIARLPGAPAQAGVVLGLYADAVGAYLERRLAGENAERIADVVQDVLLDLLGKPDLLARAQPGDGSRFRHYLMDLAWGSARNALRRLRHRDALPLPVDHDEPAGQATAAMDRAWAAAVVQQALAEVAEATRAGTLEADCWTVLELNLIQGLGLREVATRTTLSLATCSRRLARARALLQSAIADRLRLAGDLGLSEDPAAACEVLLERLR